MDKSVTRLFYQGQTLELSPEAVVVWATGTMVSPLELVWCVYWAQLFAMPGRFVGDTLRIIDGTVQQLIESATVVDDTRILQAINEVLPPLEAFAAAAKEISEWQDTHVPKKTRTAHNRATREQGPRDPPWRDNEEFKARLEKSSSAFSLYLDALSRAVPMIRKIIPPGAPASLSEQLDRALKQIPDFLMILELGYGEVIRRKAAEIGYLPSA